MVFGAEEGSGQENADTNAAAEVPAGDETTRLRADDLAGEATAQARETLVSLWEGFAGSLPQVIVALLALGLAWLIVRLVKPLLRRATGSLQKGPAIVALYGIVVWLLAIGLAVSVIAGDIRALLGSIGLVGLALSWALQTPIESFTGWLMNSFQGYYRVGDRIAVADVFGDVISIDFLTTTVWEYGGGDNAASGITAQQATGRLITFPNNEVLTGSIVNFTRDFPFVWDELAVSVAAESDLRHALSTVQGIADDLLADYMAAPAVQYREILERAGLPSGVSKGPEVFVAMTPSGVDLIIRYLVAARERRIWKSRLTLAILEALQQEEHAGRILPIYPRQQIQIVGPDGAPTGPRDVSD
jgi:small-conductance mechanosensitive channel